MRIRHFASAVAVVIGVACAASSANAGGPQVTTLVSGKCVAIVGAPGCVFSGTINDKFYTEMQLLTDPADNNHANSYVNAIDLYNSFVLTHPSVGPQIDVDAIGESAGDFSLVKPPYPTSTPIVDDDCPNVQTATPANNFHDCNLIGMVNFATGTAQGPLTSGTWTLSTGSGVDFVAVDGGQQFDLYELSAPATSGTWNTYAIPKPNGTDPQLYHIVLFAGVPEPATWAMFLVGFGAVGFMMRGSRRKSAAAAA